MIELKFDAEAMFKDMIQEVLVPGANEIAEHIRADILNGLAKGPSAEKTKYKVKSTGEDVKVEPATVDAIGSTVSAYVASYGWALIESYGTGSKMALDNEELAEYIQSSLWNVYRERRVGAPIVRRGAGSYTNFFGETVERKFGMISGENEGKPMDAWGRGRKPNYAIQNVEKRLENNGYAMRVLDRLSEEFFDNLDTDKYFTEVES